MLLGGSQPAAPTKTSARAPAVYVDNRYQGRASNFRSALRGLGWMALVGWIPFVGPFIAGYQAGSRTRSAARGLLVGLAVGFVSILILAGIIAVLGGIIGAILFGARGAAVGAIASGTIAGMLLFFYSITDLVLCTLGGLVGGAVQEGRAIELRGTVNIPTAVAYAVDAAARAVTAEAAEHLSAYSAQPPNSSGRSWQWPAVGYFMRSLLRRLAL